MKNVSDAMVSVSHEALVAAIKFVPVESRGDFALTLLGLNEVEPETAEEFSRSYQLTPDEARQLILNIDKGTGDMLRFALQNVKDGVAVIDWSDIKRLTGVTNWAQFAKGRLGGMHRSLSNIVGKPRVKLLIEEDGWESDGKGDFSSGTMSIDGPAVQALQLAFNMK